MLLVVISGLECLLKYLMCVLGVTGFVVRKEKTVKINAKCIVNCYLFAPVHISLRDHSDSSSYPRISQSHFQKFRLMWHSFIPQEPDDPGINDSVLVFRFML